MKSPAEIAVDVRLERIREAAHAELLERGRDGLRPGRVARRAGLPVDVVDDLVPDLEAAVVDEVEGRLERELGEIVATCGVAAAAA